MWADGQGGGNLGRVFQVDETANAAVTNGFLLCHNNAANAMRFVHAFDGTDGFWTFPMTDGQWNAVAMAYNRTVTSNLPVARVNFASVVSTTGAGPTGTAQAPAAGYCIGNRTGQDRGWDGRIAHLQFFSVGLDPTLMDAALRKPGSVQQGLVAWWPLWTETDVNQYVGTGPAAGTATALAIGPGAPCAWPWGGAPWPSMTGATAPPPAPSGDVTTIFRQNISGTMRRGSRPLGVA